jgi:DNA-binding SARP family transcriptional activator
MDFRILGPVEVIRGGSPLALGPAKHRALLALLLLHVNEVVSRDRLIEDLWGDLAPASAATSLHGYVSQLRKLLEPGSREGHGRLVTRAPGYLLELDPEQIDLKRFERLARRGKAELAAGDAHAAAATLAEALSLWRSQPLAEFASAPFAIAESLRLQELHVSTLEDRIEADLALARHHHLVGELEQLTAEHPFRERLHAQLMLALYRSGRQAEALEVYQKTRRRLVDELGIEPGPQLQQLQQEILRHDQAIAPTLGTRSDTKKERHTRGDPSPVSGARGGSQQHRPPRLSRRMLAIASLALLALALGIAFALAGREHPSIRLEPNSVGFVDADSGRLTKSFPVGLMPQALAVTDEAIWTANFLDKTVTHIDRADETSTTIRVGGHPNDITVVDGTVWVWTVEGVLTAISARYDDRPRRYSFKAEIQKALGATSRRVVFTGGSGQMVAVGRYLWFAMPGLLIRVNRDLLLSRPLLLHPSQLLAGLTYHHGKVWVIGAEGVWGWMFPLPPAYAHRPPLRGGDLLRGPGLRMFPSAKFVVSDGQSLWVTTFGDPTGQSTTLRRIGAMKGRVQATIPVGSFSTAIAYALDSIWVADGDEGVIRRVDRTENRVIDEIVVGEHPSALAPDEDGVWVAVR